MPEGGAGRAGATACMPARKRVDWPESAVRLATALPRARLHPAVLAWAGRSPPGERWVVACSSGADSVALLLLLWAHWPERRRKLTAVHFNHRLRGAAADRDERFGRELAAALGIGWRADRWQQAPKRASEAEARGARHAFFETVLTKLRARALWLGHQQDDIAETMLMRLARGSGLAGLAAPRPVQSPDDGKRVHLRPLLTIAKAELRHALRAAGARWREDGSNARGDFLRNRVRHEVLPGWQASVAPRDLLGSVALSRELIQEDEEALQAWLADLAPVNAAGALSLRRLAGKPRGLVRRALLQWLARWGKAATLSRQAMNALLDDVVARRRTRHSVGTEEFAVIGARQLTLVRRIRKAGRRFQHRAN